MLPEEGFTCANSRSNANSTKQIPKAAIYTIPGESSHRCVTGQRSWQLKCQRVLYLGRLALRKVSAPKERTGSHQISVKHGEIPTGRHESCIINRPSRGLVDLMRSITPEDISGRTMLAWVSLRIAIRCDCVLHFISNVRGNEL